MVVFEAEVEQALPLVYWWAKANWVQSTSVAGSSSIQAAMVFSATAGSL
jgi:hypothetical protein